MSDENIADNEVITPSHGAISWQASLGYDYRASHPLAYAWRQMRVAEFVDRLSRPFFTLGAGDVRANMDLLVDALAALHRLKQLAASEALGEQIVAVDDLNLIAAHGKAYARLKEIAQLTEADSSEFSRSDNTAVIAAAPTSGEASEVTMPPTAGVKGEAGGISAGQDENAATTEEEQISRLFTLLVDTARNIDTRLDSLNATAGGIVADLQEMRNGTGGESVRSPTEEEVQQFEQFFAALAESAGHINDRLDSINANLVSALEEARGTGTTLAGQGGAE